MDSAASEGGDSVIVIGSAILYGEGPALIAEMFLARGRLGHEPGESYRCHRPGEPAQGKRSRTVWRSRYFLHNSDGSSPDERRGACLKPFRTMTSTAMAPSRVT